METYAPNVVTARDGQRPQDAQRKKNFLELRHQKTEKTNHIFLLHATTSSSLLSSSSHHDLRWAHASAAVTTSTRSWHTRTECCSLVPMYVGAGMGERDVWRIPKRRAKKNHITVCTNMWKCAFRPHPNAVEQKQRAVIVVAHLRVLPTHIHVCAVRP